MKMFLIFDREAEELSILPNDEAIGYINELGLPLSNDPDDGDFIIKFLDDEEIKELEEVYEIFVTELEKFRGKEDFKIEPFYLTGGERSE